MRPFRMDRFRRMLISCGIICHFLMNSATQAANPPAPTGISFDRADGDILYFNAPQGKKAPNPLKTGLFDISYIGHLDLAKNAPEDSPPFFIFSAKPCLSCPDDRAIYLLRPVAGSQPTAFVYPGKVKDPKTGGTLLDSRAFYGKCLSKSGPSLVVFQREKVDRRSHLQTSVYVAEVDTDHLQETLIYHRRRLPSLSQTLKYVKAKQCHEIPGRKREMSRKQLDLRPRPIDAEDEGDESKEEDSENSSGEEV